MQYIFFSSWGSNRGPLTCQTNTPLRYVTSLFWYGYYSIPKIFPFRPILTSEGSKVRRVYGVVREMEIRMKYRLYSTLWTSIARAAEMNCYNPIYLSRATLYIRPIFDPSKVEIGLYTVWSWQVETISREKFPFSYKPCTTFESLHLSF